MSISLIVHQKGIAQGKLTLEFTGRLLPEDVLKFFPNFKTFLDELKEKNWRYVYIQTNGKTIVELDLTNQPSKIIPYGVWSGQGNFTINIDIGSSIPNIKIGAVEEFRINIATKNLPRAATIDLAKNLITYVDESFWNWSDDWKKDESKLPLALEVYDVVKWLVEDKKFTFHENYKSERYQELKEKLIKLHNHLDTDKNSDLTKNKNV
ncbi:MAG: hypothetical protein QXQ37_05675 [Nitrososphaerota archaeon]